MPRSNPRTSLFVIASILSICAVAAFALRSRSARAQEAPSAKSTATQNNAAGATDALRFNTLGVAYMNQQKFADAQKKFEQALAADPKFAVARLNLGVALLSQQKLEAARAALEEAARQLPQDPYAWYNLGLVYKDTLSGTSRNLRLKRTASILSAIYNLRRSATMMPSPLFRKRSLPIHFMRRQSSALPARINARVTPPRRASTWLDFRKLQRSIWVLHSALATEIKAAIRLRNSRAVRQRPPLPRSRSHSRSSPSSQLPQAAEPRRWDQVREPASSIMTATASLISSW
jgi:tetratricopeptide (TPR) repeat protein